VPLTGSRWDIRWLSGREKTPTFCVFPVFSVAVMGKCCDACDVGECFFRSGWLVSANAAFSEASIADDRKSMGLTVAERPCKDDDYLLTSCI
jgi:hypothetical protein